MGVCSRTVIHVVVAVTCSLFVSGGAAQQTETPPASVDKLIVILRESPGANKEDETLRPMGRMKTRVASAGFKEMEIEASRFQFLGDMHIWLVFDSISLLDSATAQDLARFKLSPEEAIQVAVANIRRLYGPPRLTVLTEGPTRVQGRLSDFDSSFFLDREFWRNLLTQYPEGIVVAVPKRHGLLFAPLRNTAAVKYLRENIPEWHRGDQLRLSSALYLFKDDRWTVFQPARRWRNRSRESRGGRP